MNEEKTQPPEPRFCGYTATGLRKVADGLDRGIIECIPGDCSNTQDELDRMGAARVLRALARSLGARCLMGAGRNE